MRTRPARRHPTHGPPAQPHRCPQTHCFHFDVATYFATRREGVDSSVGDDEEEHDGDADSDSPSLREPVRLSRVSVNYFAIANALTTGSIPSTLTPPRTFSTATTAFHLANKSSNRMTVDEAAVLFGLPDLRPAIYEFLQRVQNSSDHPVSGTTTRDLRCPLPFDRVQIWYKIRVQQHLYHKEQEVDAPQTLRALPPSGDHPFGLYDTVIASTGPDSDWPRCGIEGIVICSHWDSASLTRLIGHTVAQLRFIFRPLDSDYFAAYVQRFNVVRQGNPGNVHPYNGMHLLRRATKSCGVRIGGVIPISCIRSPAHLIPNFGKEAHSRLTRESSYELLDDFWLNRYWSKEFYYAMSPVV